jgi:hypothetical protein
MQRRFDRAPRSTAHPDPEDGAGRSRTREIPDRGGRSSHAARRCIAAKKQPGCLGIFGLGQRTSPNGLVNKVRKVDAIPPCFAQIVQCEGQPLAGWRGVRNQAMTDHEPSPIESRQLRCPRCSAFSRLTHSILDSRHGYTVHLFQCCACGQRLWEDGSTMLTESRSDFVSSRRNLNGGLCHPGPDAGSTRSNLEIVGGNTCSDPRRMT